MSKVFSIGLVGARGYTGRELLRLIWAHPQFDLAYAASRQYAGQPVSDIAGEVTGPLFENLSPEDVAARVCDAVILALPDGAAAEYVRALEAAQSACVIIDLSADHRFDPSWVYGLPELYGAQKALAGAKRIANPGCYATAAQLAIAPVVDLLETAPCVFGVSGYSGAGTTPSPKNDQARLQDNLIPYALVGHKHEKEISHHLGREVSFTPHVHPAFSGILVTVHLRFSAPMDGIRFQALYDEAYRDDDFIIVRAEAPELKEGTGIPGVILGGFALSEDGRHGVVIAAEDNLLKGAAVQAMQNLALALEI